MNVRGINDLPLMFGVEVDFSSLKKWTHCKFIRVNFILNSQCY